MHAGFGLLGYIESILTIHAHTENLSIYPQESPHPSLSVQEHRLSIAPQIGEAIPAPNKVTKSWKG